MSTENETILKRKRKTENKKRVFEWSRMRFRACTLTGFVKESASICNNNA
ncbi:hypothetical protein WN55_02398 [Dufourea novaeangliae]|uniref:Uncharacterized protein n=1 Tax=Dufourea novaeangliae TaxID=178035 RepID=A0A154PGS2_DUFNO|nr:hypothetical protein WN55_02398 [Dufourea novaeangliae]